MMFCSLGSRGEPGSQTSTGGKDAPGGGGGRSGSVQKPSKGRCTVEFGGIGASTGSGMANPWWPLSRGITVGGTIRLMSLSVSLTTIRSAM